jgi:hypothetical protein
MKPSFFTLLIALLVASMGCKKEKIDKCETVVCLNGGICDDGTCICINGFSGQLCETAPDPCAGITCLNGGTCANGVCNCPMGYSGSDCSQQLTPSSITITSVSITKFPPTGTNGGSWDFSSGPDVYVRLSKNNSFVAYNRAFDISNATTPPLEWNPISDGFIMDSPESVYRMSVMDDDGIDTDDVLGWIEFTPYWEDNGFPQNIQLSCQNCAVEMTLTVEYQF